MPELIIILVHIKQGENVVYSTASFTAIPWYAACVIAFSSAWEQTHSSSRFPLSISVEAHRSQPPSMQFLIPRGVPLYPVEIIRRSFTITAATCRREQLLRVATTWAIEIK